MRLKRYLLGRKTSYNHGLHQLLRLRFCLRGKYSDIFNYNFEINSVDLFWSELAAATGVSRDT